MTIFIAVAQMGKGKTLFSTLYAIKYSKLYPNNKIYANYNLKLKNFVFTEYMILPFSELEDCLIICDDFANLRNLDNFITLIASLSRKRNIEIILTCQYYAMVPLMLRTLSLLVDVLYDKMKDVLLIRISNCDNVYIERIVEHAVEKAKKFYDTKQVVRIPSDITILDEIKRMKMKKEDIMDNLYFFFKNKSKIEKYYKELTK